MKTNVIKKSRTPFLMVLGLVLSIVFISCNKDEIETPDIEQSEAVEAITNSLSANSNGLTSSIANTAKYASEQSIYSKSSSLNCGQLYNYDYNESNSVTNYSFNYSVQRSAQLNCTSGGVADNFVYQANRTGTYDTPRMSSSDNAVSNWTMTGLNTNSTNAIINGSYQRNGTQVSKVRNKNSFKSTINYTTTNINVDKTSHKIVSGSSTVNFVGTSSTGNQFTYNGTITFNGNDMATLVINGNTYTINL
jgi:hypothetical protein